jgi:glycosyltransferase involved in cell wall biosynthesis
VSARVEERTLPTPAGLLVVIPALNEADSIDRVVRAAIDVLGATVVVIDDGSSDETHVRARDAGAVVVRHPFNLGVGAAVRTGLRYAVEWGHSPVLQLDGDGQHPAPQAKILLHRLEEGDVDLVVGSRFASGYDVSFLRRQAMRLLSRMVTRRLGVRIADTTSGFRAFGPTAIRSLHDCYPSAYLSDTVEALLIAADKDLRVAEVDVQMALRETGRPSSGRVRSLAYLVRVLLVVLLHRFRDPIQRRRS